jgi:hypothetical protein
MIALQSRHPLLSLRFVLTTPRNSKHSAPAISSLASAHPHFSFLIKSAFPIIDRELEKTTPSLSVLQLLRLLVVGTQQAIFDALPIDFTSPRFATLSAGEPRPLGSPSQ